MPSRALARSLAAVLLAVSVAPPAAQTSATGPRPTRGAPPRDLVIDEAHGGHTLARHVGLTDEQLRDRLRREPLIPAASTFTDRATAERVVGAALADAGGRVDAWVRRKGRRPNLALEYRRPGTTAVGRSLLRGERRARPCTAAIVVLNWDERRGAFYVLTAYPEVAG